MAEAVAFGQEILQRSFSVAKFEIGSARSRQNCLSAAGIPISETGMKIQLSSLTVSRRQWLCTAGKDVSRQKSSLPQLEMNSNEDFRPASSSRRPFAATPNARLTLSRAQPPAGICQNQLAYRQLPFWPDASQVSFDDLKAVQSNLSALISFMPHCGHGFGLICPSYPAIGQSDVCPKMTSVSS